MQDKGKGTGKDTGQGNDKGQGKGGNMGTNGMGSNDGGHQESSDSSEYPWNQGNHWPDPTM